MELKKSEILNKLIDSVKNHLITSFSITNIDTNEKFVIDILNIRDKKIEKLIQEVKNNLKNFKFSLNSKNEKKFFKKYKKLFTNGELEEFFIFEKIKSKYQVILENGRVIGINITTHAYKRFVSRLLIFYLIYGHRKYDVSEELKNDAKNIVNMIKKGNLNLHTDEITKIILKYLEKAKPFKEKTLYRLRDKINHNRRKKRYEDEKVTLKLISHPFLFIINIEKGILKTVELYSSSFPNMDLLNKISRKITDENKTGNFLIIYNKLLQWCKTYKKK